ncbi:hypothetical protein [Lysinibacter cavernae]|uniref:hypothetical protein n=1 Tax=Lysinibacter cavernae TaxID=1640652 RepID=UPI003616D2C9
MSEILVNTLAIVTAALPLILASISRVSRPSRHFRLRSLWAEELKNIQELSNNANTPMEKVAAEVVIFRFLYEIAREVVPFIGTAILFSSMGILSMVLIGMSIQLEFPWNLIYAFYWLLALAFSLVGIFAKSALQYRVQGLVYKSTKGKFAGDPITAFSRFVMGKQQLNLIRTLSSMIETEVETLSVSADAVATPAGELQQAVSTANEEPSPKLRQR